MKKFTTTFFLLMAMVLLLPTELKAAEDMRLLTVELTDGSYNNSTSKLYFNYDAVNSRYYYDVKSFAGDLYFRIGIKGWSDDIQPNSDKASVPTSEGSASNAKYGKTNAWKVNIPSGSNYTIYVKLGNIVGNGYPAENFRVWIAPTVVVPTTTYTLTYGDKSVTGTVSGNVYTFDNIPYTAFNGTSVSFQLKTVTNGVTTYYNMPNGTTSIKAGQGYSAAKAESGSNWTYTKDTAPNKGSFTVTLNTNDNNIVTLTDNTSYTEAPTPVTGQNLYLVGNFMSNDGDKINYNCRYFKMTDNGDNTYSIDLPATLTVKAQLLVVDGETETVYGPNGNGYGISHTWPGGNDGSVEDQPLAAGEKTPAKYWSFNDRGLASDGMYTLTVKLNDEGVPTTW